MDMTADNLILQNWEQIVRTVAVLLAWENGCTEEDCERNPDLCSDLHKTARFLVTALQTASTLDDVALTKMIRVSDFEMREEFVADDVVAAAERYLRETRR